MKTSPEQFWEAQFERDPTAAIALYREHFGAAPPEEAALEVHYWLTLAEFPDTEPLAEAVLRRIAWDGSGQTLLRIDEIMQRKVIAPPLASFAHAKLPLLPLSEEERAKSLQDPVFIIETALEGGGFSWQAAALYALNHQLVPLAQEPLFLFFHATVLHKLANLLGMLAEAGPAVRTGFIDLARVVSFAERALQLACRPEVTGSDLAPQARSLTHVIHNWLGHRYREAGEFARGRDAFLASAAAAPKPDWEISSLVMAASCAHKAGDPHAALDLIADLGDRVATVSDRDIRDSWLAEWLDLRRELGLPTTGATALPEMPLPPTLAALSEMMETWLTDGRPPNPETLQRVSAELQGFYATAREEGVPNLEFWPAMMELLFTADQDGAAIHSMRKRLEILAAKAGDSAPFELKLLLARTSLHMGELDQAEGRFEALWREAGGLPPAERAAVAGHYLELLNSMGAHGLRRPVATELLDTIETTYRTQLAAQSGALARSRLRESMQRELETAILTRVTQATHGSGGDRALEEAWRLILLTRNPELQLDLAALPSAAARALEERFLGLLREALLHGGDDRPWREALESLWQHEAVHHRDLRPLADRSPAQPDPDSLLLFQVQDLTPNSPLLVLRRSAGVLSAVAIDHFTEQHLGELKRLRHDLSDARSRMIVLTNGVPRTRRASAAALDKLRPIAALLFGGQTPADGEPGARFRSVLCDGELNAIPLEALPVPGSGDDRLTLGLAEPLLYRLRPAGPAPRRISLARGWLGVADVPAFGPHPALPGSVTEANAIEALCRRQGAPTRLLCGGEAHAGNLAEALADLEPAVLHIAAHGVATRAYPEACALILAPEPGSAAGELLSYRQVLRLPLAGVDLVVLSACSSSVGRTRRSAGLEGLAWAFLRAGVGQVVASRWPVGDRATAQVMTRFYTHLTDHPAPEALRRARRDAREAGLPDAEVYAWSIWA